MNHLEKLNTIVKSGAQSPALAYGLSALMFAHDDDCPTLSDSHNDCNCDPDIYDGLTNKQITARPAPAGSNEKE